MTEDVKEMGFLIIDTFFHYITPSHTTLIHRSQILYARATKDGKKTEHVQANFHDAAFRLAALGIDSCTASKYAVGGDAARDGRRRIRENLERAELAFAITLLAPVAPLYPSAPAPSLSFIHICSCPPLAPTNLIFIIQSTDTFYQNITSTKYYHRHHDVIQSAIKRSPRH
jgi:hypothetical protein